MQQHETEKALHVVEDLIYWHDGLAPTPDIETLEETRHTLEHMLEELHMLKGIFADIREPVRPTVQDAQRRLIIIGNTHIELPFDGSCILSQHHPELGVRHVITFTPEMTRVLTSLLLQTQVKQREGSTTHYTHQII